jgi:hypothetical protein
MYKKLKAIVVILTDPLVLYMNKKLVTKIAKIAKSSTIKL